MEDVLADYKAREKARQDNWRERMAENDGKLYGDDLQCPHCGYVISPSDYSEYRELFDDEGGDVECPSCDEIFTVDLYVSYTWTCKKKA